MGNISIAEQAELDEYMMYLLATVDRIRAEVKKFGKCEVEKTVLLPLWNRPWHVPASFENRTDEMAEDIGMTVRWDYDTEPPTAIFEKLRESIIVIPESNITLH